jgi:hypothetical protein
VLLHEVCLLELKTQIDQFNRPGKIIFIHGGLLEGHVLHNFGGTILGVRSLNLAFCEGWAAKRQEPTTSGMISGSDPK